jgi:hypothetical protein
VVYEQEFENPRERQMALEAYDWVGLAGAAADPARATVAFHAGGYLFSLDDRFLAFNEAPPFGFANPRYDYADIESVRFLVANSEPIEDLRVAIRAGEQWYASEQVFNHSLGTTSANEFEPVELRFADASWVRLAIEPGVRFDFEGSASVSPSAPITAVGIADESGQGRIRVDSFQVTAGD